MSDAVTPHPDAAASTEAEALPVIELDDDLRGVRDLLVETFPGAQATGYRGELTVTVEPRSIVQVLQYCKAEPLLACELLSDVSAVHWPGGVAVVPETEETTGWPAYETGEEDGRIEVDYILRSITHNRWFRVRVNLPDDAPVVDSATAVYGSANFMEREAYDLMGISFTGHPALSRIMMPDDWEGHPHRKDYPLGGVEVMYKGATIPPPDEREY